MHETSRSMVDLSATEAIHLSGVRAVFFDLDNTLYAYEPCHQAGIQAAWQMMCATHAISLTTFAELYKAARIKTKTSSDTQAASHSRLLYFQKMHELILGRTHIQQTVLLESTYWHAYMEAMALFPHVIETLKHLRSLGVRIAIISDLTAHIQFQKIERMGIADLIDYIVTSEEAGVEKPDPHIFQLALEKTGAHARETVMFGDDPKKDIAGAHTVGIRAYLVKDGNRFHDLIR